MRIELHHIKLGARTVVFTWDDNHVRHATDIALIFESRGVRCTFYINPGEKTFTPELALRYKSLDEKGFDLGSHGYVHGHYTQLSDAELLFQMEEANRKIFELAGTRPTSFAFPNHDFDSRELNAARSIYLETRNTLPDAVRLSLTSRTTAKELIRKIKFETPDNSTIVFSGHSIVLSAQEFADSANKQSFGYEPFPISELTKLLDSILTIDGVQILTFEQAVVKQRLQRCLPHGLEVEVGQKTLDCLLSHGLTLKRLMTVA